MLARAGEYFISGILFGVSSLSLLLSLYLGRLAPLILSATLLASFFLFTLSLFLFFCLFLGPAPRWFRCRAMGRPIQRARDLPTALFRKWRARFCPREKSSPREPSRRSRFVASPCVFLIFLTDGNARRKLARKDERRESVTATCQNCL